MGHFFAASRRRCVSGARSGPLYIAWALLAASAIPIPAFAGKEDNSVRFAFDQTLRNLDPYYSSQLISAILADQVWDTLIYRHPQTGDLRGNLATAWRWVDEKTLEFDLRRGVKFHNGAAFGADDVVYTLTFVSDPRNRAINLGLAGEIERVVKLDEYKVRIVFKQTFPAAITFLSAPSSVIHPHAYYATVGVSGVNERPIGTGPYRVTQHEFGKLIRLERNPDYFRNSPKAQAKIEKVDIRFIPDAQTRIAEIVAGGVDLITRVEPDQADQLRGIPSLQIVSSESRFYYKLAINSLPTTPAPALRNVKVRQAILHSIDRATIARFVVGKEARVLHAPCHPSDVGCVDEFAPRYKYDPEKARQLLAEAGYASGFDIDLYAYRDRNQVEAIIGYLGAVGIRARLRYIQAAARRPGQAALAHSGAGSDGDVSRAVSEFFEFGLYDVNRDPEVRDLLVRADSAMDPAARNSDYSKALALIQERAYVLPLYSMPVYYVAAKELAFTSYVDLIPRFYEMSWK
jgi:peptide/nickel transport system substrate-binding protein